MVNSASAILHSSSHEGHVEFEQPLSERMRTFLRIEFLYNQALYHANNLDEFSARAAISTLLEILAILSRGDVRGEALKELERHVAILASYSRRRDVDVNRVAELIENIKRLQSELSESGPQVVNSLKECEFLNMIKHRSSIPGGTCMFDLPDYAYWLRLPVVARVNQFEKWISGLRPVCDAVCEVLWLTRQTSKPSKQVATGGMYQHQMDRSEQPSLVRVIVPPDASVFPEISAGKHRFTIRFVNWSGVDSRPKQVADDIDFLLALG